jgi:quercetin 2,3-dioxygenase
MPRTATTPEGRRTTGLLPGVATPEGEGIVVYRPFPSKAVREIDPFLLLDRLGPVTIAAGAAAGVPPHPHAGFEVVSYVLQGRLEHRDSRGHRGSLGPGDVQWMTAGAGIIHSEMPGTALRERGGTLEAIQLWINLPARDKQMPPRYGDLAATTRPIATSADGLATVRVMSGEALGARAGLPLRTPITYLHWTLEPGAIVDQPLAEGTEALAYVLSGQGQFGADRRVASRDELVRFEREGAHVTLAVPVGGERTEVLLLAGPPTGEPVARSGPFVMNTMAEIRKAIEDYHAGAMGELAPGGED